MDKNGSDLNTCSTLVVETIPLIMHAVKSELKAHGPHDLSVHQFRALRIIEREQGIHLSSLMGRLGGTISAASKLVDCLVDRGLVERSPAQDDRRRLALSLTDTGRETLANVHRTAQAFMAGKLETLSETERSVIEMAMRLLQQICRQDKNKEC